MNRRKAILATLAAATAPTAIAASAVRSDLDAWQLGTKLALDMLWDAGEEDKLDDLGLEDNYRDGCPQVNGAWFYLRKLREIDDDRVHAAFGAVLTEYLGLYASSLGFEHLEKCAEKPIPTICAREVGGDS